MLKKIFAIPGTVAIMTTWILIYVVVVFTDIASILVGKGISNIGIEYYRFLTAGLVHKNLIHLIANVLAIYWVGYLYEKRIGTIKYLVTGVLLAMLTQVIFLLIYSHAEESFGGSVYIFAFCGLGVMLQRMASDYPKIRLGTWSGNWLVIYMIAANIPFMSVVNISTVVIHAIAFAVGVVGAFIYKVLKIEKVRNRV